MASTDNQVVSAIAALEHFSSSVDLTSRISGLEFDLRGADGIEVAEMLSRDGVGEHTLAGALVVKRLAGQINVVVHALGILLALPAILREGEVVEDLSLGAGNTGRSFDLTTDLRIAEFKFISWQGGAESIRQNSLFVDLYHLAVAETDKLKQLYVTDLVYPTAFLRGRRALRSVLSKHGAVADDFFARFGDRYQVVREYWDDVKDQVDLIDVAQLVPAFIGIDVATDSVEGEV